MYWGDVIYFISTIMLLLHSLYGADVGRQQGLLFLWRFLREYGLIFSHDLHDVARGGDGTIMVQGGYSLALEDQEILPLWKESPIYSSIMIDGFDMWDVKGWSYEVTGALSQRPTTLSLGSLGLLIDYP